MSCLPEDALSHFEQREQELLALNRELEQKRARALAEASSASEGVSAAVDAVRPGSGLLSREAAGASVSSVASCPEPQLLRPPSAGGSAVAAHLLLSGAVSAAASAASRPGSGYREPGSEALHTTIRFQNERIVNLQEELEKAVKELRMRGDDAQRLEQENKQAQDEVARLTKVASSAEKQRETLKSQLVAAEEKAKDLEREKAELLKEKSSFDIQQRRMEAEGSSKEARMNRLIEENEKFKAALKDAGAQDKDRATSDRRELERLQNEVRKLERQRSELVNAFKKQMKLIEVLKRQRAHMEAARVLSFTEEEFIRVLELGDKLGE